jgi:hypothetical protein
MPKQVLIVIHQEHSNPGRVGELLIERGCTLDRRSPDLGDRRPGAVPFKVSGGLSHRNLLPASSNAAAFRPKALPGASVARRSCTDTHQDHPLWRCCARGAAPSRWFETPID